MILRNLFLFLLTIGACLGFSFAAIKISNATKYLNVTAKEIIAEKPKTSPNRNAPNAIQVALLLDTSGSMNGLIEQAKSQLWNILNELARTRKKGQDTELQIALYEYGNPQKADRSFQIHQLSDFTNDMDLISEKLFSLTTSGGEEYCGAVIKESLDQLSWNDNESLKMIYIAGNEEFYQGPINYSKVCKTANANGIVVNTIFCGDEQNGVVWEWNKGAAIGGGEFISISHNDETVYISTPYDDEINVLNKRLNETYIPYGEKGNAKKSNQITQDANAVGYSRSNAADRISFKSSKKYKATDWDLVDAYKKDKSMLKNADIKSEKYKSMSEEELEANIEMISQERSSIQSKIRALDKKRRAYKTEEVKKKTGGKEKSLQQSILQSVRKQAEKKGFEIED